MDVTDEQWAVLEPLIPEPPHSRHGRGRLWRYAREALNCVLWWVLRTGRLLSTICPAATPPYETSRRRFQRWARDGMLRSALEALAEDLEERGGLSLSECFIDVTFVVANRGRAGGKDQAGQGTKLTVVGDRSSLPLAV